MADNTNKVKDTATAATAADANVNGTNANVTDTGRTVIENTVVSKIAGIAAREVSGVHALGGGAARMMGSIRDTFGGSENVQQGISVEVGETQAAVDLSVVAEYGVAIHELAEAIRRNIARSIERMTGLEVTEVNVNVTDVHLPQDDKNEDNSRDLEAAQQAEIAQPRVQ
ncbi:Asp23/Gls24 family envelope stress response protein [Corynebacterium tapiri]|uniref:Asp23/Gls24 family envelope stress response protein n=1 Tax=Corynebacterium tapiri TaxID=1448266 RepID=A0A5C4U4A9_9CORY|nr:Asp23/Gls24 family envelope stress response protein [Corynebacterium tapiri]TNL98573.1 Asp23/Gls24 family envelope stress response protein [Corynebacterium tapiri]